MLRFLGPNATTAAVMAAAAALVLAPSASATHVGCGDVVTQDTTLDSDLFCEGDGLTVAASDATLDLGGHLIQGTGSAGSRGVMIYTVYPEPLEPEGVEVRDGAIRDFSLGAEVDDPEATVFSNLSVEQNDIGIRCHYALGCRITDSVFRANGTGISLEAVDQGCRPALVARNLLQGNRRGLWLAGCDTVVIQNRIEHNATRGVEIEDGSLVEVSENLIADNGTEGVYAEYLATVIVSGNRIVRNGGDGVHLDGGTGPYAPRGIVRDNRIVRNGGDGVHTTNVWDRNAIIERNRSERNGDDGIDVDVGEFGSPITVRANRAFFNVDLGIEADPGTIDGGGNRAKHNGNPLQCVGVQCR
jgi:nitrous oxidase accessory protein NosD